MVQTTKELSFSNWPVLIQLCCYVPMLAIMMSHAVVSLGSSCEAVANIPLHSSTPVANTWEEKAEQLSRCLGWCRALNWGWMWWKRCNTTTFLKLFIAVCWAHLREEKKMAGSPKSPAITALLHLSPVNKCLMPKTQVPTRLRSSRLVVGWVLSVAGSQVHWACHRSSGTSLESWHITFVAIWVNSGGLLLPF